MYSVNELQTQITEEILDKLSTDIKTELLDIIDQIELVDNMINGKRKVAADLERDKKGRIKVDVTKPHKLENMDYFRPSALYYEEHGTYTHLYPNPHPTSEYRKFWDEEKRRCINGYVRESDGEWISGYYYFYLNFSPIMITIPVEDEDENDSESDNIRADRIYAFPNVWDGDYLYFHYIEQGERDGEYGNILKTRGRGFSFKGGAMYARNYYFFARSKSYAMASEKEYLTKDGILNKAWDVLDWVDNNTPFGKARDYKDQDMHKRASYRDTKTGTEKGFKSEIIGVTLKNDPQKARGKRGKLIGWEESGVFPGLSTAWSIARMSLEEGRRTFGYMVAFGTGGTEGANFESALKFFYSPEGYRIKSLRNVYDKVKGNGRCSFFYPEYLNRADCYDKDGNSDIIKALLEILEDRQKIKDGTTDPHAITQEKADRPITPEEAVMIKSGTLFPINDLKEVRANIVPRLEKFIAPHYVGDLVVDIEDGKIKYQPNIERRVVREFPIKDNLNKEGAIEMFELPNNYKPRGRYIAGIDPVDDDHSTTNSLCSIFVLDTFTDRIVAEYTGRPNRANEFYQLALRLLKYYNAIGNYENDKKGLYGYFLQHNALHYLCDNPEILKDMDMIRGGNYGNKKKGTPSGKRINQWGRRLQADWMLSPSVQNEEEIEKGIELLNVHKIRSLGYINECIAWNIDGNFDRVSAMGMLMILREELRQYSDSLKDDDGSEDKNSKSAQLRDMIAKDFSYKYNSSLAYIRKNN